MATLNKNNTMALPTPNPEFDYTKIIQVLLGVIGTLILLLNFMNKYFKDKALDREAAINAKKVETEEFIKKVATACVTAVIDSVMGDVKEDIKVLFRYREEDKTHWDKRFDSVMTAVKK